MNVENISHARTALTTLAKDVGSTGARIEILLDRLASALIPLASDPMKSNDLSGVLAALEVNPAIRKRVREIYSELESAIESRNYGDEDEEDDEEDAEETLANLVEDFCDCLSEQLDLWEDELAK